MKVYTDKIEKIKDQIKALEAKRKEIDKDNNEVIKGRLRDIDFLEERSRDKENKLSISITENKKAKENYDAKSKEAEDALKDTNAYLETKSAAYHKAEKKVSLERKSLADIKDLLAEEKVRLAKIDSALLERTVKANKDTTELEKAKSQIKFSEIELERRDKKLAEKEIDFTAAEIDFSLREKNLSEAIKDHDDSIKLINEARIVINKGLERNDIQEKKIVDREEAVKKSIKKNQDKENSLEVLERSLAIKGREIRERLTLAQNLEEKLLKKGEK